MVVNKIRITAHQSEVILLLLAVNNITVLKHFMEYTFKRPD